MERNISIDYLKIVLCIGVIMAHLQPLLQAESYLGWVLSNGLGRVAVPFFFIINGYYIHSKASSYKSVLKYLKKMLVIYITWTLIYIVIIQKADTIISFSTLIFGIYHLWFISALIMGIALLYIAKKFVSNNYILLAIVLILFCIGLYIQHYYFPISRAALRLHLYRNALFYSFPFIFVGYFIKEKSKSIKNINNVILFSTLIIGLIIMLYETHTSYMHKNQMEILASSLIINTSLFLLILKYSKYKVDDGYIGLLAGGIYFTHILIKQILIEVFPSNDMQIYLLPMVLFLSALATVVVIQLNKRIKIFL